ncbi:hypothetical protein LIER_30414 [Lithospermum erythrorhizon]|uniref:Uncharacterized protein n=1 Tax=Lithospermum erythrorhizon TaxID=34254 RepID=A0AAV3RMI9_LITER
MVKVIAVLACLLIVVMDATAGILGIKAEAAQNKVKQLRLWIFECKKPSHEAFILAAGAAIVLAVAHFLANLIGCIGCFKQNSAKSGAPTHLFSKTCCIILWIVVAVGLVLLVIGTLSNKESGSSCGLTHRHYLSYGGFACFAHALFAVAYIAITNAAA